MACLYRVGEVSALTGVSVRTLHHYDRIGLICPSARSDGGHRLYAERDLLRLQQVLTLRYLGFSLRQIDELLTRSDFDLVASMRIQRGALRDRISELERIEAALGELVEHRQATGTWPWDLVTRASAAVQGRLKQKGATVEDYYTPEQLKQFAELAEQVPAEERQAIEQGWTELIADVRANHDLDPTSSQARALADRWNDLMEATFQWYREKEGLWEAIGENYRAGRFDGHEHAPTSEDRAFIARVNAAREGADAP